MPPPHTFDPFAVILDDVPAGEASERSAPDPSRDPDPMPNPRPARPYALAPNKNLEMAEASGIDMAASEAASAESLALRERTKQV